MEPDNRSDVNHSRVPIASTDPSDWLCVRIVEEIANREGTDPARLPPLAESTDPDGLARLVDHAAVPITVSFRYIGYEVRVSADGQVSVTDVDA